MTTPERSWHYRSSPVTRDLPAATPEYEAHPRYRLPPADGGRSALLLIIVGIVGAIAVIVAVVLVVAADRHSSFGLRGSVTLTDVG